MTYSMDDLIAKFNEIDARLTALEGGGTLIEGEALVSGSLADVEEFTALETRNVPVNVAVSDAPVAASAETNGASQS